MQTSMGRGRSRRAGDAGPERAQARPDDVSPEEVWFSLAARDGTLVGTDRRVVHRRTTQNGGSVREWSYEDLRSLEVVEEPSGVAIVLEPHIGPLVSVPVAEELREQAYQAATVLALLIVRAHRPRAGASA